MNEDDHDNKVRQLNRAEVSGLIGSLFGGLLGSGMSDIETIREALAVWMSGPPMDQLERSFSNQIKN